MGEGGKGCVCIYAEIRTYLKEGVMSNRNGNLGMKGEQTKIANLVRLIGKGKSFFWFMGSVLALLEDFCKNTGTTTFLVLQFLAFSTCTTGPLSYSAPPAISTYLIFPQTAACPPHGPSLTGSLGNSVASRILFNPNQYCKIRFNPNPPPPCIGHPYRNASS